MAAVRDYERRAIGPIACAAHLAIARARDRAQMGGVSKVTFAPQETHCRVRCIGLSRQTRIIPQPERETHALHIQHAMKWPAVLTAGESRSPHEYHASGRRRDFAWIVAGTIGTDAQARRAFEHGDGDEIDKSFAVEMRCERIRPRRIALQQQIVECRCFGPWGARQSCERSSE